MSVRLFTIGFAATSAERFFTRLREAGVKRVVDVRLNNTSQLSGFTKRDDLRFFLEEVAGIEYLHVPKLAPTQDILDAYKKHKGDWSVYEQEFNALMAKRGIENAISRDTADLGCLLCSEKQPHHCHRRLVAEYLERHWGDVRTDHLVSRDTSRTDPRGRPEPFPASPEPCPEAPKSSPTAPTASHPISISGRADCARWGCGDVATPGHGLPKTGKPWHRLTPAAR